MHPLTHSLTQSLTHSLTHSLTRSLARSLTTCVLQDRAAALAALASHFWQARNKATPSGLQPDAPGRAVPSSPKPAVQSNTYLGSPKEQLQSIATTASGITADIDAAAIAADELSQQQASRVDYPGDADNPGDMPTGVVDNLGAASATVADSSKQHSSDPVHSLSEREHRMAARLGKLQQRAACSSFEGKAGPLQGKPSGQTGTAEGQVIPQSDGPADDDDMPDVDAAVGDGCMHADVSSSASALHWNAATNAQFGTTAATAVDAPGPSASKAATAAAMPATASTTAVPPAQPSATLGSMPADASTTAVQPSASAFGSMPPGLFSQPVLLPSQPPPAPPASAVGPKRSTHQPSALEQMAARYLYSSSSARPQHAQPTQLTNASLQAAATSSLDPAQQSAPGLDSSQPQEITQLPVSISMPAQSSGLDDVVASSGQSADDTAPQQRSTAVHVVAFSGQSADDTAPQQRSTHVHAATLVKAVQPNSQVVCPCSGRKHHFSCLSAQHQLQVRGHF